MTWIELLLTAVALSMDAFAVSTCKGLNLRVMSWKRAGIIGLFFGGFQALMPLIGWLLGKQFEHLITSVDHWIVFVLLSFIGGKMIWDAFHEEEGEEASEQTLTMPVLLFQAVATSIDALAVGVSFAALEVNVLTSSGIIGITTALTCIVALCIGKRFGNALGEKATIIGGAVLILIGLKSLLL